MDIKKIKVKDLFKPEKLLKPCLKRNKAVLNLEVQPEDIRVIEIEKEQK